MISATRFIQAVILTISCTICIQQNNVNAQSINLIHATSQGWAGGVCCRQGENYNIQLKIVLGKTPVVLDSLWLKGYCMSIAKYNPKKVRQDETVYVTIMENIVTDDYYIDPEIKCYDPNKVGVSFTYYIRGKKKLMDITPYIKELEFIAYP